jgi:DNA replication and repair protein RecF
MALEWLQIGDFRCISQAQIEPAAGINLIRGKNASGKTSLLEAIFFLGRGRSFRSAKTAALISDGSEAFTVVGRVVRGGRACTVGVKGQKGGTDARLDGAKAESLAELARALAVQVIDPEVHKLIEEGPGRRRRFLDWGVFHVEHGFLEAWRRYRRALKQRNAALKEGVRQEALRGWEAQMIQAGIEVGEKRGAYLEKLNGELGGLGRRLLDDEIEVRYHPGWFGERGLEEALEGARARDEEYRTTHVGPHRADVIIKVGRARARDRVSRGQQKLLAAALILSQMALHHQSEADPAVLLLDDPGAELDADSLARLLAVIETLPTQRFITALPEQDLGGLHPAMTFHVEQGKVREMI